MLGHEENILIQSYFKYVCIFEIALFLIHEKMRGHGYRIEVHLPTLPAWISIVGLFTTCFIAN